MAADLDRLESSLTWIWGSPRSGSSWLLSLLSHPLRPDPDEELGFRPPANPAHTGPFDSIPIDESFISNHMAPALGDPSLVDGHWYPGTLNNLLSGKPAYVFSSAYEREWRGPLRELALKRIAAGLDRCRERGIDLAGDDGLRIPIKETNGSHAADVVMATLPASRLLLLIRDGRDVVDSLMAAYQPGGFMARKQGLSFGGPEQRDEGLAWAARLWATNTDVTLRAMESHDPALTRVVRYEDLLEDTPGELRRLYEWLGLRRDSARIDRIAEALSFDAIPDERKGELTRNRAATPGLWRENLSRGEQKVVGEICSPLLDRFGYLD